jgi:hypothetical protein
MPTQDGLARVSIRMNRQRASADGLAAKVSSDAAGGAVGARAPHALATRMTIAALTVARFRETPA